MGLSAEGGKDTKDSELFAKAEKIIIWFKDHNLDLDPNLTPNNLAQIISPESAVEQDLLVLALTGRNFLGVKESVPILRLRSKEDRIFGRYDVNH